jgi:glycogen phosphorylase
VQGVDVWINTPKRPWEACGTSGMKVLVNGGINISVLDGWWDEAYAPDVGWAIPNGEAYGSDAECDATQANQLYDLLEKEIIPEFYTRNAEGIPVAWVNRMRESMARLTPHYSANRSVRQYTQEYYLPAAQDYLLRAARKGEAGIQVVNWKHDFEKKWKKLSFGALRVETKQDLLFFEVQVYLHDFRPDEIRVELFAADLNGGQLEKHAMQHTGTEQEQPCLASFSVTIPAGRPAGEYTPRIVPGYEKAAVPLESAFILWHR